LPLLPSGEKAGMRGGSCAALDWAWLYGVGWVARLLACGGLSCACRRPSSFSLLAQREGTKRNGLSSPPTLQALSVEVFWNRRGSSCSTDGHSAPSPLTEVRVWVSRVAALRSLQRDRTASFLLRGLCSSPSFRRRPESSHIGVRLSRRPTAPARRRFSPHRHFREALFNSRRAGQAGIH